ncbi:DUF5305 family protein [Actinoplanes teichomyceticus]|nr:DUF5305 family protein [Actinoplanes teichomyceticus]
MAAIAAWAVATHRISYVVTHGVSMEPTYRAGDLAVLLRADSYEVGQIAAYHGSGGVETLHRIIGGDAETGYVFQGDNNPSIDAVTPTADELIGRAVLHVPHGGAWLRPLLSPTGLGVLGFLVVSGGAARARTRRDMPRGRRKKRVKGMAGQGGSWGTAALAVKAVGRLHPALRVLAAVTALCAVAGTLLAVLGWMRPATEAAPSSARAGESMTFSYSAEVGASAAYDGTVAYSPDPIYRKLTDLVDLQLQYRGAPGRISVDARLSSGAGWHSTMRLSQARPFTTDRYTGTVLLDLDGMDDRVQAAAKAIGSDLGPVTITVTARVEHPDGATFEPQLSLALSQLQLALPGGPGSLVVNRTATTSGGGLQPRRIGVLGHDLTTAAVARRYAGWLLLAAVAGMVGVGMAALRHVPLMTRAQIERRYGHLLVPVEPVGGRPDEPVVTVATFPALVRLAEKYGQMVLTWTRPDGADDFVVRDDGVTYRYRIVAPRPSTARPPLSGVPHPARHMRRSAAIGIASVIGTAGRPAPAGEAGGPEAAGIVPDKPPETGSDQHPDVRSGQPAAGSPPHRTEAPRPAEAQRSADAPRSAQAQRSGEAQRSAEAQRPAAPDRAAAESGQMAAPDRATEPEPGEQPSPEQTQELSADVLARLTEDRGPERIGTAPAAAEPGTTAPEPPAGATATEESEPAPHPTTGEHPAPPPTTEEQPAPPPITEEQPAPPPITEEQPAPPPITEEHPAPPPTTEEQATPEGKVEQEATAESQPPTRRKAAAKPTTVRKTATKARSKAAAEAQPAGQPETTTEAQPASQPETTTETQPVDQPETATETRPADQPLDATASAEQPTGRLAATSATPEPAEADDSTAPVIPAGVSTAAVMAVPEAAGPVPEGGPAADGAATTPRKRAATRKPRARKTAAPEAEPVTGPAEPAAAATTGTPQAEAEAKAHAEAQAEAETRPVPKSRAKTRSPRKTKPTITEPETRTEPDRGPEAGRAPESDRGPEAGRAPESDRETEVGRKTETNQTPETDHGTEPSHTPEANHGTETDRTSGAEHESAAPSPTGVGAAEPERHTAEPERHTAEPERQTAEPERQAAEDLAARNRILEEAITRQAERDQAAADRARSERLARAAPRDPAYDFLPRNNPPPRRPAD